jgi:hypothetical protein
MVLSKVVEFKTLYNLYKGFMGFEQRISHELHANLQIFWALVNSADWH